MRLLAVLLLCIALPCIAGTKLDLAKYLKEGYVVSILPSSHSESFILDEAEKHVYAKVDMVEAPAKNGPYRFVPVYEATIFPYAPAVSFNTSCFQNYTAKMSEFSTTGATITIEADHKTSTFCADSILIASRESIHFFEFFDDDTHNSKFSWANSEEALDIKQNGFQVLYLPNGYLGAILDIWETYQLFKGVKSFADGIKFMTQYMNFTYTERDVPNFVIPESEIMDGDYLAIFGPSNDTKSDSIGVASLISIGTGGRTSHAAICIHIDGELYVLESCGRGIIKTPYAQWMTEVGPQMMISLLRLREDLQEIFNVTAAIEYFESVEGLPYGDENFVYGWIDTIDGNYPPPLNAEEIPGALVLGDLLVHDAITIGVVEGLNQRLGTSDLTIPQILSYCDANNMTVQELIAMPELESYIYPDPPGPRMVCDVFALKVYKAAGIFGDLEFEATELTPKDSYQVQIFSNTWERPQACANATTPGICQFSGMYWLDLPGFNSVTPYAHMNEKCAAVPTEYIRTPVGC